MKRKHIVIISVSLSLFFAAALVFALIIPSLAGKQFRLDDEYYGESEALFIGKDEYEKLVSDKKSFVIMVDKPGCIKTSEMSVSLSGFPDDMQFKYYHMYWDEAKESSLHEKVKYTPSVALIHDGEIVDWLDADAKEDEPLYNDPEALQNWIREFILF
jgi:hypothetical protein